MPPVDLGISTLDRVCAILNAFSESTPTLTLTEISRRVGLPKSTTHRMLEALERQGMIIPDPQARGFQIGYQVIRWGTQALNSLDIRKAALPIMRSLAELTHETVVLSCRYGTTAIWLEVIESSYPVRLAMRIGQPLSLHAGASAKVLWGFLSDDEIETILQQIDLTPIQPKTITDRQSMRDELRAIRERGYATSFEETDPGAMGIAAPIFDHTGLTIAGIGIAAPISRIQYDAVPRIAPLIVDAGRQLSQQMGAPGVYLKCHTLELQTHNTTP